MKTIMFECKGLHIKLLNISDIEDIKSKNFRVNFEDVTIRCLDKREFHIVNEKSNGSLIKSIKEFMYESHSHVRVYKAWHLARNGLITNVTLTDWVSQAMGTF